MKKLKFILIIVLSFIATAGYAQSDCEDKILKAEKLYESGKYSEVVNLLKPVLEECDLSKTQKGEVLKYLAGSNYEIDELEEADKFMMKFIKINPYYEINASNDPYAFREEFSKFKTWPLFIIGFSSGIPINNIIVEKLRRLFSLELHLAIEFIR